VTQLVEQAMQSTRSGRFEEANGLWHEVLALEPRHTQALRNLGEQALQRRDLREALTMLEAARLTAPTDLFVLLALADARESAGDADGELEVIRWALAVDPLYVPALLKKGRWYERHGKARSACDAYSEALKSAGSEIHWPGQLRSELEAGRNYIGRHTRDLHQMLCTEIADYVREIDNASVERWREAASLHAGRSEPYASASTSLHIPRLPALPFFEPSGFPFLADLETGIALVRDELAVALERGEFLPHVAYRPDEPVNQWQELNHSSRWSAYHLWQNGQPVEENLENCPAIAKLLEDVELCELGGIGPNVFFSALAPITRVPPHHGATNARVIAHLPLIVPEDCGLRVGFEERCWREGEILVFDDTIENEAFNDSNELRVVMSFDLWNPLLSDADRQVAKILAETRRSFGN
jgi:aspartyl/asparaginyl beta-hydroxylase (cupin superfamily)